MLLSQTRRSTSASVSLSLAALLSKPKAITKERGTGRNRPQTGAIDKDFDPTWLKSLDLFLARHSQALREERHAKREEPIHLNNNSFASEHNFGGGENNSLASTSTTSTTRSSAAS